jgi:hypothetical protein
LNAYKYNEEKTLSWLQRKTERVAEVLKQKGIHMSGGAVSATFVKSGKSDPADSGKPSVTLKATIFTWLAFVCLRCFLR